MQVSRRRRGLWVPLSFVEDPVKRFVLKELLAAVRLLRETDNGHDEISQVATIDSLSLSVQGAPPFTVFGV